MATHELKDTTFKNIQDMIFDLAGIFLNESKREMVLSRLSRVVNKHKFKSIEEFVNQTINGGSAEKQFFINILTTNKTSFFRESYHFDILENFIRSRDAGDLDIWCSAASTGEEPYTIAMVAANVNRFDLKTQILATDIDTKCLLEASKGVYTNHDIEGCMIADLEPYFEPTELVGKSRIIDSLKENIKFKRFNLLQEFPGSQQFDVIFCRNVMIYFDQDTQRLILEMFKKRLKRNGILFIGHSENFTYFASDLFRPIGKTTYAHAEDTRDPIDIIGGEL